MQLLRWGLAALTAAVIWLVLLSFPFAPMRGLDPAWQTVLNEAWARGWKTGSDVVFTYGPWGWLTTKYYDPATFWPRLAWEFGWNALVAISLVVLAWKQALARRIALVAFVLAVAPIFADTVPFLVIAGWTVWCMRRDSPRRSLLFVTGVLLGLLALQKFTYLVLAGCGVGGAMLQLLVWRQSREAFSLAGGALAGSLGGWLLAGQPLSALPLFLQRNGWIATDYGSAMSLNEPAAVFWYGLATTVAFLALVWSRPRLQTLPRCLTLTALGFLTWKSGFVRADGHTLGFFSCMLFAGLLARVVSGVTSWRAVIVGWGLALIAAGGFFAADPNLTGNLLPLVRTHLEMNATQLTAFNRYHVMLDQQWAQAKVAHALPAVRAAVGDATVDQFGYEQLAAVFNDLNYEPRPVFQSYAAYSGPLAALNAAYYRSPDAPDFTLLRLETIDGRYPPIDDAALLPELILRHEPVLKEKGFLLLHRRGTITAPPALHLERSGRLRYRTEHCDLPAGATAIWARIDTPLSWLGWIRTLLYKPPQVRLILHDATGADHSFRLISQATRAGFLLSPLLTNTDDFERLAFHHSGVPVQSFRIEIASADAICFLKRARFELFTMSELKFVTKPVHQ
ncbi:MAG TPA: hypothetical protein VG710_03005 [Opitutus sp.]|nr:hypothetical protein [Opitutus sp.]